MDSMDLDYDHSMDYESDYDVYVSFIYLANLGGHEERFRH